MELDEMQTLWNELSTKVNKQNTLTDQLILTMTQERYKNKFRTITTYETIASFIAAGFAVIVLFNLHQLDTWYLLACGIFTAAHLLLLPPVVLLSLKRISQVSISNKTYRETLLAFAKAKQWMLFVQRLAALLNFVLMLAVTPLAIKLINKKDIFKMDGQIWFWLLPFMLLILALFSVWGYRLYQRKANAAEQLIRELEN